MVIAIGAIRDAIEKARSHQSEPRGRLRINASVGAARRLSPIIFDYLDRYPEMTVDIVTDGRAIDIVRDGFDAGVRLCSSVPQDMIAVPFGGELRFAVVGSPRYFEVRDKPVKPSDLDRHRCIQSRSPNNAMEGWTFERNGEAIVHHGAGPLILDEPTLMLEAARTGVGLAFLSEWNVADDVERGRLVRVLADWMPPSPGLALYYPGRRHLPAGLRALVSLLRESRIAEETPAKPAAG